MISYDDPKSMAIKADYVKARKLGGMMFWELSGDDPLSTRCSVRFTTGCEVRLPRSRAAS
jgi:GH18 family chitinase